jgi:hypothetical protein
MIPFKTYITGNNILLENGNYFSSHLSHLEDLAIEKGKAGFNDFVMQVSQMVNKVKGFESEQEINAKIDGSPSILFGYDPKFQKGVFFVALKYVIDEQKDEIKENAKLMHNDEEINNAFAEKPELAKKLKSLLVNLSQAYDGSGKIYQGDVLYTSNEDKKRIKIGNEEYLAFEPNTILYAVPMDEKSPIFHKVLNSNVGVVVHDSFKGVSTSKGNIKLRPAGKDISSLIQSSKNSKAFIQSSNYRDVSFDISDKTIADIEKSLSIATTYINNIDSIFDKEYANPSAGSPTSQIVLMLKIYLNKQVDLENSGIFGAAKTGSSFNVSNFYKGFKEFVKQRLSKGIEELTAKGKSVRDQKVLSYLAFLEQNQISFINLLQATFQMVKIKYIIIEILSHLDSKLTANAFFRLADGSYTKTKDEGFVLFLGNNQVKIVDRVDFTKMNRLVGGGRRI